MKHYQAIVFDLFSTIALWRTDRLPLFEWRGKTSHSTMGHMRETVESIVSEASFETFVDAIEATNEELAARRSAELIEFSSNYRFALALHKAGYTDNEATRAIAQRLSLTHMELLTAAVEIPPAHTQLLNDLARHYPLALISNFDHTDTALAILRRDEADRHLKPIVISDEHGWRKPHRKIFTDTLETLGVAAQDTLYVGDSVADDIVGAKGAGLDIAWVNPRRHELPDSVPKPDYEIAAIPELTAILLPGARKDSGG